MATRRKSLWTLPVAIFSTLFPSCSTLDPIYEISGPEDSEHVILLHGLARSHKSMRPLGAALASEGFGVCNVGYPSTKNTIPELHDTVVKEAIQRCQDRGATTIHFAGHSMGAILSRYALEKSPPENSGKLVQLAPPNQGSEVVDKLGEWSLFVLINGPAGSSLGTGKESAVRQLGPVTHPTLVIAGTRSINPLLSLLIPGTDDGKVSVENTKVAGTSTHKTLPISHPYIMKRQRSITEVLRFLQDK